MKKYILLSLCLMTLSSSFAQLKDFKFKFYGQIRTDFYYNSRANEETVDGLFYMYPKDEVLDSNGEDLNDTSNSNFYTLYSRLGLDVAGPKLGTAKTSAKVEADFRGSGTSYSTIRLRHAYFNLDWGKSAVLVGQTWHPLFGDVSPQILNLSVGAPFQPFSRAPQIRYRFNNKHLQLTGALVWQSQYLSQGPAGKSQEYIKKSNIPEIYVGADSNPCFGTLYQAHSSQYWADKIISPKPVCGIHPCKYRIPGCQKHHTGIHSPQCFCQIPSPAQETEKKHGG